ncbi:MAG: glycerol kinase GlpK [Caldilineaceae bacterium]|nr:glycerol kinase GlpK [Caldilineaceae bacterium]
MRSGSILALDQGTTNTKAILVDSFGRVTKRASRSQSVTYPRPTWVEQDAQAIWRSVQAVIDQALEDGPEIAAVAVSNQRESVILWERESGQPLGPCVVWQCQRGTEFCQTLRAQGLASLVQERTGLTLDPMFSGTKMRWLLDHTEDGHARAAAGELCLGTVDSWVLYNLTGGQVFACDMTNASRTQLFNLHTLQWDAELCEAFGIPVAALPNVRPSSTVYGETVVLGSLPAGIPVAALVGDSHGALYGHAGFQPGSIKATYGTGSSLMTPIDQPILSRSGLATTVAWATEAGVTYALEGNIYVTGAAVAWLGQLLGLTDPVDEVDALAGSVTDSNGVYLVPAFVGLGAPHWSDSARGTITGLTQGTTLGHLARATLESIAYQIRDVFDAMQAEAGVPLTTLLADGGPSRNDGLMQFQADILHADVVRSATAEVSALGAAYLAGLAVGVWASEAEISNLSRDQERFAPHMTAEEREALYAGWLAAIAKVMLPTA